VDRTAAGTEVAALTPDEICKRDGDRLERLRSSPKSNEAARFANELGCEKLRPQLLALMESLDHVPSAPAVAHQRPSVEVGSALSQERRPPVRPDRTRWIALHSPQLRQHANGWSIGARSTWSQCGWTAPWRKPAIARPVRAACFWRGHEELFDMNRGRKEFAFFSLGRVARPGGIMVRLRQRVQRRAQRPFKRRGGASLRSIGPIRKARVARLRVVFDRSLHALDRLLGAVAGFSLLRLVDLPSALLHVPLVQLRVVPTGSVSPPDGPPQYGAVTFAGGSVLRRLSAIGRRAGCDQRSRFRLDELQHDACGNKRHPLRDAERIAGRVVRFVVSGQQDGYEHVMAEAVAKFGDDLLAGALSDDLRVAPTHATAPMADRCPPPIGMPAMSSRTPITISTAMITTTTRRTFPSGSGGGNRFRTYCSRPSTKTRMMMVTTSAISE
jgi:hypothetical protein